MSVQTKDVALGDVVLYETPLEYCRVNMRISRDLAAAADIPVGGVLEPDGAVAQVHTYTCTAVADGGTYKLGYKGQWTTALAFDANAAAIKAAFEALSTVDDTITASAALVSGTTITWTTNGAKDEIDIDARLLTDGGVSMDGDSAIAVTTIGSTASDAVILATGANADYILLEMVTKEELLVGNNIERAVLTRGPAVVDWTQCSGAAAQMAAAKTALIARGIDCRTEATTYSSGC